jgi:hypothetical protein
MSAKNTIPRFIQKKSGNCAYSVKILYRIRKNQTPDRENKEVPAIYLAKYIDLITKRAYVRL